MYRHRRHREEIKGKVHFNLTSLFIELLTNAQRLQLGFKKNPVFAPAASAMDEQHQEESSRQQRRGLRRYNKLLHPYMHAICFGWDRCVCGKFRLVTWYQGFKKISSTVPYTFQLPFTFFGMVPILAWKHQLALERYTKHLAWHRDIISIILQGLFGCWASIWNNENMLARHTIKVPRDLSKFSIKNHCFPCITTQSLPQHIQRSGKRQRTSSRWIVKSSHGMDCFIASYDYFCAIWCELCILMQQGSPLCGETWKLRRWAASSVLWESGYLFILTSPGLWIKSDIARLQHLPSLSEQVHRYCTEYCSYHRDATHI